MDVPSAPAAQDFIPDSQFMPDQQQASATAPADFIPDGQFKPDAAASSDDQLQSKYGTPGQQIGAGLEGVAQGVAGPLATAAETGLSKLGVPGLSGEDQRGRAQANPWTHNLAEGAGFVGSLAAGVGEAALLGKAGAAVTGALGLSKAATVGAKLAAGATTAATEMGLLTAGDEVSSLIQGDPDQSFSTALAHVGLAATIGAATGGAFSGVGMGVGKILDSTMLKEFSDRLASPFSGASARDLVHSEAENVMEAYNSMNSEVTGASGLKSQAIAKLLPEQVTPKILEQTQELVNKSQAAIEQMVKDQVPARYVTKFQGDMNSLLERVTSPQASVADHFDALNNFKQTMQDYSKGNYGPFAIPRYHEAYDFLNSTKSLGRDARLALEDSGVWGKAATIQKDLNASWSQVLPAAKDFTKKFMVKVGDVPEVSQDKLNTYLNQVGKATATTDKQRVLSNFVEGMSNHFDTVDKIYQAAGVENPFGPVGMSALKESLNLPSPGARLADALKSKLEAHTIGHGAAAAAGGVLGHGYLGALIGEKALGPVFTAMAKPILERYPNMDVKSLDVSMKFLKSIQKGNDRIATGAAAVASGSARILSKDMMPTKEELAKLDEFTKGYKPQAPATSGVSYYMPDHATALAARSVATITYINSQRPNLTRANPLDPQPQQTSAQKHEFNRMLEIAQQPLVMYDKIGNGTLTGKDVATFRALHPAIYNKFSTELMNAATNQVNEGKQVPFRVQQSMSLFLGHPLNSVLTPNSIQAAQNVFAQKAAEHAQMQQSAGKPNKMSNASKAAMTGDQARENRQNQKS